MMARVFICLCATLLLGCDLESGRTGDNGPVNFRKVVKPDAAFVGQELQVPVADSRWDWLLPDLDGLVRHYLVSTSQVSSADEISYQRSYLIEDNLGFVWHWPGPEHDSYLMMTFAGDNGYFARVIHNTHALTLDELILAVFFDSDFAAYLQQFETEYWRIEGVGDAFDPEPLAYMGERLFDEEHPYTAFEGRIVTLNYGYLHWRDENWIVCDSWDTHCAALPATFNQRLDDRFKTTPGLMVVLKLVLDARGEIRSVIAGEVKHWGEHDDIEPLVIWPLPEDYPGAGSLPWFFGQDHSPESFEFNARNRVRGTQSD